MPDIQTLLAIGIVALVAGRLLYRRLTRHKNAKGASACGDCASAAPPKAEATLHFYRRRDKAPNAGADDQQRPAG
ncbi:MAG: hypothetical protein ABI567_04570 [Gammaproteobacteria bacterium]